VLTILLAAIAMLVADVLSVLLVQAEARNRAILSGVLDTLGWGAGMVVTFSTIDALNGRDRPLMFGVIAGVSLANFAGSWLGVRLGKRYVKEDPTAELSLRVSALESRLSGAPDPP
jgi:asparagine N-glycosylation enzyme membrane subunit Stt3